MPADDRARRDWQHYSDYLDQTRDWRLQRDKMIKFRAGQQWQSDVSEDLKDRDQVDIVVNKIRPLIKMRVSLMAANKPMGHIYGVQESDVGSAAILQEFAEWHWDNSDGQIRMLRTVDGQNTAGVHYFLLYSDNMADYGRGELRIADVSYKNVFLDKGSREWDFKDAPRIIHSVLVKPEDFYLRHPNISRDESFLVEHDEPVWEGRSQHGEKQDIGAPRTYEAGEESWIREIDVYERKIRKIPVIVQKQTGVVLRVLDEGQEPEEAEKLLMQKNIGPNEFLQVGVDPNADPESYRMEIKEVPLWRVEYRKSISGMKNIGKPEILPISEYPLIPVIGEDTGNAMPYGEVDNQAGMQELLNTCVSLTLLNAALGSNLRTVYDPAHLGELTPEELQQRWAVPGAMIPLKINPVTGRFPLEVIRPEALNQAWFTMYQALSQELQFQISTFSLRGGDPSQAPDTFAATLQLGQWAQDVLRIPLTYLESAVQKLYNVMLEWIPKYYDFHKVFYILNDKNTMERREINAQVFSETQKAYESLHSITNIRARYRIKTGSTMPSQSVAELSMLQSLAQLNPALLGSVVDRMPGLRDSEKQEIKNQVDMVAQLGQKNKQLEDVVKMLQQQMQHLNQANLSLQHQSQLKDMDVKIKKELLNMQNGNKK